MEMVSPLSFGNDSTMAHLPVFITLCFQSSEQFGCLVWSHSETHLLYVAEKKRPEAESFFQVSFLTCLFLISLSKYTDFSSHCGKLVFPKTLKVLNNLLLMFHQKSETAGAICWIGSVSSCLD